MTPSPNPPAPRRPAALLPAAVLLAAVLALPGAAKAKPRQPGLARLIPLLELYDARKPSPEGDVAWIRCAAQVLAERQWHLDHRAVAGPSRARQEDFTRNLKRAEQLRSNRFKPGDPAPSLSVEADLTYVADLYLAVFAANAATGVHPWSQDRVMQGDRLYCDALAGRKQSR